jgi:hypothetical protein
MNECNLIDEGLMAYELAWHKQKQLFNESIALKLDNKNRSSTLSFVNILMFTP